MRLHRLEIQAFGPFANRQVIDFDAVADSGLFLLHGPTGAGKTSVLDAVCFALFGRVPGSRAAVSRLRSDHAAPGVAPEVVCEFSVGPRRLEITRSPAWERAKRRGGGSTTQQARVVLRELDHGRWHAHSTRIDEVGDFVGQVLGMGVEQFTKLVLLPQGEFTAFLRADAESRRVMLERLFGADRYTRLPAWLREQRAALLTQVEAANTQGRHLSARVEQVALTILTGDRAGGDEPGGDEPGGDGGGDTAEPATDHGDAVQRATRWLLGCEQALEETTLQRERARTAVQTADQANQRAVVAAARAQSWLTDRRRLTDLEANAAARRQWQHRLSSAERAAGVAPLAPVLRAAEAEEAQAADLVVATRERWRTAAVQIGEPDEPVDVATRQRVGSLLTLVTSTQAELGDLDAVAERLSELRAAREASTTRRALLHSQVAEAEQTSSRQLEAAAIEEGRAAGAGAAQQAWSGAVCVHAAALERERLTTLVAAASVAATIAENARNLGWQSWLELRERRLAGIAAELAAELSPGQGCRVCGSLSHPHPASVEADAVTKEQEQRAHQQHLQAQRSHAAAIAELAELGRQLAASRAVAGELSVDDAARARREAKAAHRRASESEHRAAACRGTAALAAASAVSATAALVELNADDQRHGSESAVLQDRLDRAHAQEAGLLGPDRDLTTRRRNLNHAVAALDELLACLARQTRAQASAATTRTTTTEAALAAGFGTLAEAVSAILTSDERHGLTQAVHGHDRDLADLRERLRQPEVIGLDLPSAVAALDPTHLAARRHDLEQASLDDAAAGDRRALADSAVAQLRRLYAQLRLHGAQQGPLQAQFHELDELTRCLDGTGGGNTRKVTLSAFVLATRLDQVARAASLRLAQMSDGRYGLEHSEDPQPGRQRSGLALVVRDAWTGRCRETATLSGGEAFYTSLALALGLADVVAAEAGGTAIDTLFVDEGFGSLDDETLDEVLDVLDGLRSGGRTVGLVSHVADLRRRIPTQVEVRRTPAGSTVHLLNATG